MNTGERSLQQNNIKFADLKVLKLHSLGSTMIIKTIAPINVWHVGEELFSSEAKYDSGSGWPSFFAALDKNKVEFKEDKLTVVTPLSV